MWCSFAGELSFFLNSWFGLGLGAVDERLQNMNLTMETYKSKHTKALLFPAVLVCHLTSARRRS